MTLFDNLSRPRTEHNLAWLREQADASRLHFVRGDIRQFDALRAVMGAARPDLVAHLASQVAVTTSVQDPRADFEINAIGTFNVLEAARAQAALPAVFYASTNKVYGNMEEIAVVLNGNRYRYRDFPNGISEQQPLDFHSPYGCSKGAGDQYVRDYARIYGMRTVVFRQSTIYGARQFGVEDQGWLAHFMIAAMQNQSLTIYGDGKQVRDMLNVRDLVRAYEAAWNQLDVASGQVFNVGGGAANTLTIWAETGALLESLAEHPIPVTFADWRPGDQKVFISDNTKIQTMLGWQPQVNVQQGMVQLWDWVTAHRDLFT